jgi:uncharacterized membrane protein YfcA
MIDISDTHLTVVALTFVLAGVVKGVTGMGLPTVCMAILAAFMPPVTAASLLVIPSFVTNAWQLVRGSNFRALSCRLSLMLLGIVVGTVAGCRLLLGSETRWATLGLGVALVIYGVWSLRGRPVAVPARMERWLSPSMGLTTGLITGGTGVFVIPAVPYLQALGLRREDLVQALGLSFTISTISLAIGLAQIGAFHLKHIAASAVAIIPALLGMWLGTAIRHRIRADTFRRWFMYCLILLGVELVIRPMV